MMQARMDLDTKRKIKAACRPDEPVATDDPRHYDFDVPTRLRGLPWRSWLADEILMSSGSTAQLVTGLRGSGKTTELRQLEVALEEQGYEVIYADIGRWLNDREPITVSDLQLSLVLALFSAAMPEGASERVRELWRRVSNLLWADVTPAVGGGGPVSVQAGLEISDTVFQQASRRLREQDGLRKGVFDLIAERVKDGKTVLLLDGGEKRATGNLDADEVRAKFQNAWFAAFIHEGQGLRPPVHVIYTVPPFMIRRTSELAASFGSELRFLPMVRVFERSMKVSREGLEAMVEALALRVPMAYFEDAATPAWLAAHCGGYFRDLLRFINHMLHVVGERAQFSRADAEFAVEQVRQTYTQGLGLSLEERQILKQLYREKKLGEFPSDEKARVRMDVLLEGNKMFRYHNGRDWYAAHPLFRGLLELEPALTWAEAEGFGEDP
ncbi:hypothetical protein G6O69_33895 [Pseudenhygromyxa sp. WMMC2535]|uniref:hypothetical protein n=1 Tax=Pseudenhygromyxa sp. WMMC2535 TaxID=2712867 RepID=UPI001594EA50|nr:hypothetical protein [Pseudenhygromyxa sp. WMMC2535]NVB42863.1 hypothetical protein [Pseudenhygromyxa sp. WMMC2535]